MKNENTLTKEMSEINLKLEQYDDIFSDFDIRPYSKRALSVDFLDEIKRATSDKKEGEIELILHAPEAERDETNESIIKERLAAHFKRHYHLLLDEKKHLMKTSFFMVFMGVISMIAATLIVFEDPTKNLFLSFLIVFLEPAAWFLLWEGMEQIMFNSKNINPDLNFYKKMHISSENLNFKSY